MKCPQNLSTKPSIWTRISLYHLSINFRPKLKVEFVNSGILILRPNQGDQTAAAIPALAYPCKSRDLIQLKSTVKV